MRIIFLIIFLNLFSFSTTAQKVEYLHDSLFVNNYFVDAQISKFTLDSLLGLKGKTKSSKSNFMKNPKTGKMVNETAFFYYELGLFFRKYDHDTSKLSIGIKLHPYTDKQQERQSELKDTFKGQLYIAENFMNDKISIEQLKKLNNCSVTVTQLSFGSYSSINGGDIIYEQNMIRLAFDTKTNELKMIFIHHNFKDK